ncbi:MAG: 7-carboxy-7-deazaguanine synthase QueE [Candidatus Omnitrophica bacterium]|nr:7-carboxy-7-deazaguanine synthase QueE [Candidatus Omnitrophota bacterium]MBU2045086.1 7-carboxy-7-deazaguanine synthase QueE [Candidatus Omnitrophota bacterium]MBU2251213.1 7-carboxy-7-deazaguanine synthase QueE [Candidatus Omnitrophota bacterium]MBU2473177.1 7-carboxy-7-deazaguanine synthase QueE [Candidatus Omnitrophota bacterium]
MKAKISEIFKSIQGEGLYQGREQVFVRFFGCNLNCRFCDTRFEFFKEATLEDLVVEINSFGSGHSVSLTGGEPLLQVGFLGDLIKELKKQGQTTYLEANGTLPDKLSQVIDNIDIVAMDFKLPSSTGDRRFWSEHRKFLEIARSKKVFVKVVIGKNTQISDLEKAIEIVGETDREVPFILQPENPFEDELEDKLDNFKKICQKGLADVRVIPQLHKIIGVR